jgi:hypothetical protein
MENFGKSGSPFSGGDNMTIYESDYDSEKNGKK